MDLIFAWEGWVGALNGVWGVSIEAFGERKGALYRCWELDESFISLTTLICDHPRLEGMLSDDWSVIFHALDSVSD